ncbi:putative Transcriptional regulator, LysR family protein [metagenome]|uniref:Putative Transcriptional regulator, LysR family protein n=1 Tax=metagenome TaxID=256318 RepID=A0A2P2C9V9_9ZZZZ
MALMNVELRHLRAFVTVARTSNFTRAAEELLVSQPALSYTIRQLEAAIGVTLFHRTTRSTALTAEGEIFLTESIAVLARFEEALGRVERLTSGELGRLRVGYLIGAAVDHVPAILRAFAARYPDVSVDLLEYDFASPNGGIDAEETDVAIVRPPLYGTSGLVKVSLLDEARYVCVPESHPFAALDRVALLDVLGEPIVAAPGDNPWRDYWTLNEHREAPPQVTYEAATFEAEMQAVAYGRGVSVVPAAAARLYSHRGVRFVLIEGITPCEVAVVRRVGAPRAAANFARLAAATVTARLASVNSPATS